MQSLSLSLSPIHHYNLPPLVSLILPIRNEARYIERTLRAVLAQDYPADRLEILIVDGMSGDGTREIIARILPGVAWKNSGRLAEPFDAQPANPQGAHNAPRTPRIALIDNPARIVPAALNLALRRARGEIVVRVDGHCEIAADYVSRCVQHLQERGVDGVGGPIETVGETFLARAIAVGMSSKFGVGGAAFRTVQGRAMQVDTIAFPAYTRETVRAAGLFDEELVRNQDDEYNYRIRKLGGRLWLFPDVRARYYSRASLGKLWSQYFQYGFWKVRVLQKHPRQMRPRQFVPPLFVAALLLSPLLVRIPNSQFLLPVLPALYLLANLIASLRTAASRGWRYLPVLPSVFAVLHLAYGLGFLAGLVRFAHRWGDKTGKTPEFQPADA